MVVSIEASMVRETVGAGAGEDLGHDRVEADGWMLRGQEWTAAAEAAADPVMLTTVLVSDASDTPVCVRNGGEPVTPGRVGDPPDCRGHPPAVHLDRRCQPPTAISRSLIFCAVS